MTKDSDPNDTRLAEVLVVGAGVAGLSCASELRAQGVDVRVLEKSRGVGGRCATRRIEGVPVDHGLAFFHGDHPDFLSALHSVEAEPCRPWPLRVVGEGAPCQPRAFRTNQRRIAFAGGVSTFPKHLARGIPVDLQTRATRIAPDGDLLTVATESGTRYRARSVVLALPAAQAATLLGTLAATAADDLAVAIALLSGVSLVPCLTLMAGYGTATQTPDWDVWYPRSEPLQMVSQDSAKRRAPAYPVFVFQGRPRWSAEHWDDPPAAWTSALLGAATTLCGDRLTRPLWTDTQRWRYARLAGGDALTAPLLLRLEHGCRIGIAGEALDADGGAQGAWLSGRALARRLRGIP